MFNKTRTVIKIIKIEGVSIWKKYSLYKRGSFMKYEKFVRERGEERVKFVQEREEVFTKG